MKSALIENGVVVNIIEGEIAGSLPCPQEVGIGWFHNGTTFTRVPRSISPLQARRAMRQAGLLAAVKTAIAKADEPAQEAWEYATEIRRDDPTLAAIWNGLKLTSEQVDELFCSAATP